MSEPIRVDCCGISFATVREADSHLRLCPRNAVRRIRELRESRARMFDSELRSVLADVELCLTVERAKREVRADIATGTVPATVRTFSALHDHVDANGYGGAFEVPFEDTDEHLAFWNAVQTAVNDWLQAGRPD
jgi:hypothetical protein